MFAIAYFTSSFFYSGVTSFGTSTPHNFNASFLI
tara:strand:+ start:490 stop:591 length:102 start_codon:yes stop_codon:yes gene_type:complete